MRMFGRCSAQLGTMPLEMSLKVVTHIHVTLTLVILYSLAVMEQVTPKIVDQLFGFGDVNHLLLFLVNAMYSPDKGFFLDIPRVLSSIGGTSDSLGMAQELDSHILHSHIRRISSIISRTFALVGDPVCLFLALDKYGFS